MLERYERQTNGRARDMLPAGFVIVRGGTVRPDDLVFSWTSSEWLRADDPGWLQTSPGNVADCTAVARATTFAEPGFAESDRRTYQIPKPRATPEAALRSSSSDGQRSLF